jgi:hypothetical protein
MYFCSQLDNKVERTLLVVVVLLFTALIGKQGILLFLIPFKSSFSTNFVCGLCELIICSIELIREKRREESKKMFV